jgi:hypothetical protein
MPTRSPLRRWLVLAVGTLSWPLAVRADAPEPPILGIEEPSGVRRVGDQLLVVGDEEPGTYYTMPVTGQETSFLPLAPAKLTRHHMASGLAAFDLESIDVLADGRVVVLSERLPGLFDEKGLVVQYPQRLMSFGGRGPEGVAVLPADDGSSRVAILWEGGYPEPAFIPPQLKADECVRHALHPRVFVHRLPRGAANYKLTKDDVEEEVELAPFLPPGKEPFAQRYRAPDLVWRELDVDGKKQWGWIVLLSSGWGEKPQPGSVEECRKTEHGEPLRWCGRFLQRFTMDGKPFGDAFDLDEILPNSVRSANWEGLGWFTPGHKLVIVYDESIAEKRLDPQQAYVFDLPAGW